MPRIGDLVKWKESSSQFKLEKAGILVDILENRGHYSVVKILTLSGDVTTIRYMSELPEILSEYSSLL